VQPARWVVHSATCLIVASYSLYCTGYH